MANAVAARIHGDDYQALVFWQQACRLLRGEDEIDAIEIESEDLKSLDDVVIYFKDGHLDQYGQPLKREGFQVKYHVDFRGCITANSLIDPAFINATAVSFLQRAFNQWKMHSSEGLSIVFCSMWPIDPNDELSKLVSGEDGHIAIDKLEKSGARSKLGKIKGAWRAHLKVSDDELLHFLSSVRIIISVQKELLLHCVNNDLTLAGLSPITECALINPYYELARSFIKGNRVRMTRDDLLNICKKSKLWRGQPLNLRPIKKIGIRSRLRSTEGFVEWAEAHLELTGIFNDRQLKDGYDWSRDVFMPIDTFLKKNLRSGEHCEMWLPVHSTIAVAIGYMLDAKSGVDVHMHQTTVGGTQIWCNKTSCTTRSHDYHWIVNDEVINDGSDLAIAISVTHDIMGDVRAYLQEAGLHVSTLRCFSCENCGQQAIADQEHAVAMIEKVVDCVRQLKRSVSPTSRIHVFFAMPNFMAFALGQRLRPLGLVQLYEHKFDSGYGADYAPSLQFPSSKGE